VGVYGFLAPLDHDLLQGKVHAPMGALVETSDNITVYQVKPLGLLFVDAIGLDQVESSGKVLADGVDFRLEGELADIKACTAFLAKNMSYFHRIIYHIAIFFVDINPPHVVSPFAFKSLACK
jgi:hypothetical protein